MNLTLIGEELRGLTLRFENPGASPAAVIRSARPAFYASHDVRILDSQGRRVDENQAVNCCASPYGLSPDILVVIPPGESREMVVNTMAYQLPPGPYRVRVTYRTNRHWLDKVKSPPPGFEHLIEGEWTSNEVLAR